MKLLVGIVVSCLAALSCASGGALAQDPSSAPKQERRVAFVVGNGAYPQSPLPTAANDAGLIAQTLQAAGFDVVGARDLDGETLRRSFKDFIQKVQTSGPDTVAFVYLAGRGLQLSGENYFAPIDAKINRDTDVPVEALRVSDYTRPLAALPIKATIVVLDAARPNSFAKDGQPLAGGLSLVEPDPKMLIAFNAAPGTVAPEGVPPYGAYAQALAEMIRAGGLPLPDMFDRVRLRVNEMTKGAEIPWDAQRLDGNFMFFDRAPDAPASPQPERTSALRTRPIRDFSAAEAYTAAIARDTLQDYEKFLVAFPTDALAARVRAILAARREAIIWRRSYRLDTPPAYWSYLDRYPRGPHAYDARRRLAILAAALTPPPSFVRVVYDVPPPPPEEIVYIDRPVLYFSDPVFTFAPPPPPPVFFLPPPPPNFVVLAPPPPPIGLFVLPTPFFVAMPAYVSPPPYIAPPPNNIIFTNIHNTTVINNVINAPASPTAQSTPTAGSTPAVPAPAPAPAAAAALPSVVARKAAAVSAASSQPVGQAKGAATPTAPAAPNAGLTPNALPGSNGQPLPKPATAAAPSAVAPLSAMPAAKEAVVNPTTPRLAPQTVTPMAVTPKALMAAPVKRTATVAPQATAPKLQPRVVAQRRPPPPAAVRPSSPPPRLAVVRPPPAPRPQPTAMRPQAPPRPQAVARMQVPRPAPGPRPPCKGNACKH